MNAEIRTIRPFTRKGGALFRIFGNAPLAQRRRGKTQDAFEFTGRESIRAESDQDGLGGVSALRNAHIAENKINCGDDGSSGYAKPEKDRR